MTYHDFCDGQTWINDEQNDDYAEIVEILSGRDVSLADNQYMIQKGTIYFSPGNWNAALSCIGYETIGPPEFFEIAYAFNAYQGFDLDTWGGFVIVQIGKTLDDWTTTGTTHESDVVLHGNTSIERYLEREYL